MSLVLSDIIGNKNIFWQSYQPEVPQFWLQKKLEELLQWNYESLFDKENRPLHIIDIVGTHMVSILHSKHPLDQITCEILYKWYAENSKKLSSQASFLEALGRRFGEKWLIYIIQTMPTSHSMTHGDAEILYRYLTALEANSISTEWVRAVVDKLKLYESAYRAMLSGTEIPVNQDRIYQLMTQDILKDLVRKGYTEVIMSLPNESAIDSAIQLYITNFCA